MPYYSAGDYYTGDGNYAAGGLSLKKIVKGIGKAALSVAKLTPAGQVVTKILESTRPTMTTLPTSGFAPTTPTLSYPTLVPPPGQKPKPGLEGTIERILPGGDTGYIKRRRMDPLNVKALRRAGRRVKGFLKIARRLGALPVNRGKGKRIYRQPPRPKK